MPPAFAQMLAAFLVPTVQELPWRQHSLSRVLSRMWVLAPSFVDALTSKGSLSVVAQFLARVSW